MPLKGVDLMLEVKTLRDLGKQTIMQCIVEVVESKREAVRENAANQFLELSPLWVYHPVCEVYQAWVYAKKTRPLLSFFSASHCNPLLW